MSRKDICDTTSSVRTEQNRSFFAASTVILHGFSLLSVLRKDGNNVWPSKRCTGYLNNIFNLR